MVSIHGLPSWVNVSMQCEFFRYFDNHPRVTVFARKEFSNVARLENNSLMNRKDSTLCPLRSLLNGVVEDFPATYEDIDRLSGT
jgi:hypothetical protein